MQHRAAGLVGGGFLLSRASLRGAAPGVDGAADDVRQVPEIPSDGQEHGGQARGAAAVRLAAKPGGVANWGGGGII